MSAALNSTDKLLELLQDLNRIGSLDPFVPLHLSAGTPVLGYVDRAVIWPLMQGLPQLFDTSGNDAVYFNPACDSDAKRTSALNMIATAAFSQNILPPPRYKYEGRPVGGADRLSNPIAHVWREYCRSFGVTTDCSYVLACTISPEDNTQHVWLQRRGAQAVSANLYDLTVGEALMGRGHADEAADISALKTALRGLREEAGLNAREDQLTYIGSTHFANARQNKNGIHEICAENHHAYLITMPWSWRPASDNRLDIDMKGRLNPHEIANFERIPLHGFIEMAVSPQFAKNSVAAAGMAALALGIVGSKADAAKLQAYFDSHQIT